MSISASTTPPGRAATATFYLSDEQFRHEASLAARLPPGDVTPEVLEKYARASGADDPRWHFLTGSVEQLKGLIVGGFKLAGTVQDKALDTRLNPDIIHSTRLVLVDRHGEIRGYYDGVSDADAEALVRDARKLLEVGSS